MLVQASSLHQTFNNLLSFSLSYIQRSAKRENKLYSVCSQVPSEFEFVSALLPSNQFHHPSGKKVSNNATYAWSAMAGKLFSEWFTAPNIVSLPLKLLVVSPLFAVFFLSPVFGKTLRG